MFNTRVTLCLALLLGSSSLSADALCDATRKQAREETYLALVAEFRRPKAYWSSEQASKVPGLLRTRLSTELSGGSGCTVLGVLDTIDNLDKLSQAENSLRAEILWSEGELNDARKAARDTPLEDLFARLFEAKVSPGSPEVLHDILRQGSYKTLKTGLRWGALRLKLQGEEAKWVLSSEAFVIAGTLPDGFEASWLNGHSNPPASWESAWVKAWSAKNIEHIRNLLNRADYYFKGGIPLSARNLAEQEVSRQWDLPYLWASQKLGICAHQEVLTPHFWQKVEAASLMQKPVSLDVAKRVEAILSPVASNSRDSFELAQIRLRINDEASLQRMLLDEERLLKDPGISGWSLEATRKSLASVRARLKAISVDRLGKESNQRLIEERRQEYRLSKQQWEMFLEVKKQVPDYIRTGNQLLKEIVRVAPGGSSLEHAILNLQEVLAPAMCYPSTAQAVLDGVWKEMAGSVGVNKSRARTFDYLKSVLRNLQPLAGQLDPVEPKNAEPIT